jgi:hypothetical protein
MVEEVEIERSGVIQLGVEDLFVPTNVFGSESSV